MTTLSLFHMIIHTFYFERVEFVFAKAHLDGSIIGNSQVGSIDYYKILNLNSTV